MRDAIVNVNTWESLAEDCRAWKSAVLSNIVGAEADHMEQLVQKRAKLKGSSSSLTATEFVCSACPVVLSGVVGAWSS